MESELGRSRSAILSRAYEMGLRWRGNGTGSLNLSQIAALLGRDAREVSHWLRAGKLRKLFPGIEQPTGRVYSIEVDDLITWMESPASWHLWEVERLIDPCWREHFREIRAGWMTTAEATRMLYVGVNFLRRHRREIPKAAYRDAGRVIWWHRERLMMWARAQGIMAREGAAHGTRPDAKHNHSN